MKFRRTALRTKETHERYKRAVKNPDFIATAPSIEDYTFWRIINNEYPHDTVAEVHHMLVPRRKFADEWEMTVEESIELMNLKRHLSNHYDKYAMNFPSNRTVPSWLHYHLYIIKVIEE